MAVALAAALSWGTGDFFGGLAARRGRVLAVAFTSQTAGLLVALVIAPLLGGEPTRADLAWGFLAGFFGGFGLLTLYEGMAVVAPVAALGTAVFPAAVGFASGDRLTGLEMSGVVVALFAIWLLSQTPDDELRGTVTASVFSGLLAGVGFGGLLIGLAQLTDDAGFLPLIPTRLAGALVLVALAGARRRTLRVPTRTLTTVIASGAFAVIGNGLFIVAAQEGPLALLGVVASLFPAATVILARAVLHERLPPVRVAGLSVAAVAVAMISAG